MGQPRLVGERKGVINKEKNNTVILPLRRASWRIRPLRALFYLFLLIFFLVCLWVTARHIFAGGSEMAETVANFLICQGVSMPK